MIDLDVGVQLELPLSMADGETVEDAPLPAPVDEILPAAVPPKPDITEERPVTYVLETDGTLTPENEDQDDNVIPDLPDENEPIDEAPVEEEDITTDETADDVVEEDDAGEEEAQ